MNTRVGSELIDVVIAAMHGLEDTDGDQFYEVASEYMRRSFESNPNPLVPWSVFNWAVDSGRPVPGWVLQYLRSVSANLHRAVNSPSGKGGVKREAEAAGKALGFGARPAGVTGVMKEAHLAARDFSIAVRAVGEMESGVNRDAAVFTAAETFGVSYSTANRALQSREQQARSTVSRFNELMRDHELRNS